MYCNGTKSVRCMSFNGVFSWPFLQKNKYQIGVYFCAPVHQCAVLFFDVSLAFGGKEIKFEIWLQAREVTLKRGTQLGKDE